VKFVGKSLKMTLVALVFWNCTLRARWLSAHSSPSITSGMVGLFSDPVWQAPKPQEGTSGFVATVVLRGFVLMVSNGLNEL
jgi:hypothetical protein